MKTIFGILICLFVLNSSLAQTSLTSVNSKKEIKTESEFLLPMTVKILSKGENNSSYEDFTKSMEKIQKDDSLSEVNKLKLQKASKLLFNIYSASSFDEIIYLLDSSIEMKSHAVSNEKDVNTHYFVFSLM